LCSEDLSPNNNKHTKIEMILKVPEGRTEVYAK
jgi:hypothetical protein